jgi:prepilin-type N-terminal cleavage/methylation domain-containing protein
MSTNLHKLKIPLTPFIKGVAHRVMRYVHFAAPRGFTLLELLLVIAVVAVLAGIILFVLNPAQRLEDANSAQTMAKSEDIRKAIEAYAIANAGSMPTNIASLTTYGLYDICKAGQSTNCLNLDQLVTDGYLGSIPEDKDGSTTVISGYKLEYNPTKSNVQVYNTDNFTNYIEDGATLTTGLVGWWKMDEGTGVSTQNSSGYVNNGTLVNGSTWITGQYANGINLDGVNDTVVTSNLSNASTTSVAFSAWIKKNTNPAGWTSPFSFSSSQNGFFIPPAGNTLRFQLGLTTSGIVAIDGTLDNNGIYGLESGNQEVNYCFIKMVYLLVKVWLIILML